MQGEIEDKNTGALQDTEILLPLKRNELFYTGPMKFIRLSDVLVFKGYAYRSNHIF